MLARARDGMNCRYSHISGACANRHVESLECIGPDKCEFSGMNVIVLRKQAKPSGGCGHEEWLGLYCEKYQRFFCPGREHCVTPESYRKQLAIHQDRLVKMREEP